MNYRDGYAASRERFDRETADHELTVLRDDGLYRHLRFQRQGSWIYGFDLVTWPGYLAVVGDAGDYLFSRTTDMFEFFEGDRINPDYWAQKLQGGAAGGTRLATSYSHDVFRSYLLDWATEACGRWGRFEGEIYPDLLCGALEREVLADHTFSADEAMDRLRVLADWDGLDITEDAYGWELRDHDWSYLWCCWAIVRGIEMYRAEAPQAVPA